MGWGDLRINPRPWPTCAALLLKKTAQLGLPEEKRGKQDGPRISERAVGSRGEMTSKACLSAPLGAAGCCDGGLRLKMVRLFGLILPGRSQAVRKGEFQPSCR